MTDALAVALLDDWRGPYGGLPPFDRATPELIERAVMLAVDRKRHEIAAITANPAPPDFTNTVEALEDSGRALRRAECLRAAFFTTRALGEMPAVNQRLAPVLAALEDEIAHNDALFARINAVYAHRSLLTSEQHRLTEVVRDRMLRRGAGLPLAKRARLAQINASIASTEAKFHQNMIADVTQQFVLVDSEVELDGLPEFVRTAAARLAAEKGHPGKWMIANKRPEIWPTLQMARNRALRRRVRDMWMTRCGIDGPCDNRPIIAQILKLRGEKARLLGYPTFAHWAIAGRMARTPEAAMAQLLRVWEPVRRATLSQLEELQALADADGLGEPIKAWDKLYYAEKLRRKRFGLDAGAVKQHLELENILKAMFQAASRLHGLSFRELQAPSVHPDVRVFEVTCGTQVTGVIWFDLLFREGKMRSSWQLELRAAESFRERIICYSNVCSNLERQEGNGRILMGWEYANVLFHEFGHALHMILCRASYPSLGSMAVAWDLVEVPSQLNERWLYDRDLLKTYAVHHETGRPMPDSMIEAIEAAAKYERVVSVGLEYLAPAIVDLRIYLAADGNDVDPIAIERQVYEELGMPDAIDPVMRVPHQHHSFTEVYAAGLYVYLWADVMVADVLEAFAESPGGLYDAPVARRWRDTILATGNSVSGQQAFQNFRGRDPDPNALLRRFGLV